MELRPYQADCVRRAREAVRAGHRRVLIQADTGSGKSLVAAEIMRSASWAGNRCLFLAHARELVNQCSRKLTDYGLSHGVLMAGRGQSLGELIQVGSTGTLISRVLRRKTMAPPPAKLVVQDECHRVGDITRELLRLYPGAVLLGLTATPRRGDGRGLGGPGGFEALVQAVPRSRLIADGYLVRTRVYAPYRPDMRLTPEERAQGVRATGADGDYTPAFRGRRMDKPELVGDIVTQWKRLGENRPTIFFGSNVSHSVHVAARFNECGVPAAHLDASSDDQLRRQLLGDHRGPGEMEMGKIKILCNFGVLVEGIDLPCVGCVIMGRPTKSFVVYKQGVGRGCRPYSGPLYDKNGYAILIDHAAVWEEHGLPDTDIEWTLDPDEAAGAESPGEKEDPPRLVSCPECYAVFRAQPVCPECGHRMKKERAKKDLAENKDGLLVEIAQGGAEGGLAFEQLRRLWQRALGVAAARDGPATAALQMFQREAGLLPWNVPGLPHVPVGSEDWKKKVRELFPQYWRGRPSL